MDRRHALVLEDNELLRDLIRAALERAGLEVVHALSGAEALEQLERASPHLFVADSRMRGMEGLRLLTEARGLAPGVPFLVLRGFGAPVGTSSGALAPVEFLRQPLDADALGEVIGRALDHSPATAQHTCAIVQGLETLVPAVPADRARLLAWVDEIVERAGVALDQTSRRAFAFALRESVRTSQAALETGSTLRLACRVRTDLVECVLSTHGGTRPVLKLPGSLSLVRSDLALAQVEDHGRRLVLAAGRIADGTIA